MLLKIKKHDEQIEEVDDVQTAITSTFVKKNVFGTRIDEIEKGIHHKHVKYVTTQEFNQLTSEKFEARLKQASLASKNNIGKTNLDKFKTNF